MTESLSFSRFRRVLASAFSALVHEVRKSAGALRVAFNVWPVKGAWGGGNEFLRQMVNFLRANGHTVTYELFGPIDWIVIVDPRRIATASFGLSQIENYKTKHPTVRVLHRINDCDIKRFGGAMNLDDAHIRAGKLADKSIFISRWLQEYYLEKWYKSKSEPLVIHNGADPKIFFPSPSWGGDPEVWRVITHHWSDNPMKGFGVYSELDRMAAEGRLPGFELHIVGRWPLEIDWKTACLHPPTHGKRLADLLRSAHIYLTASLLEPGGMHHIEGAQCGLPVAYHENGGAIPEMCSRYGVGFRDDPVAALKLIRSEYKTFRAKLKKFSPSGEKMCREYLDIMTSKQK